MAYSTISKPNLHFNNKIYTGTGSELAITGVGHQPDFVWIKDRDSSGNSHNLTDAVRGAGKGLFSNLTSTEYDYGTGASGSVKSFDSDGYTLGTASQINANGTDFVSWNWKANGAGSANTDGTINTTSTSVNTTAGFSISTYTGTGSAGTIGHGLGAVPDFWQIKARSETRAWYGWSKGMSYGDVINWSHNGAKSTDTSLFTSNAPTNQVINLGSSVGVNNNGITFVCYAWRSIPGFSKIGLYTGNGNTDGTFVYTGFKPSFVMTKRINGDGNWQIIDTARNPRNPTTISLFPDTSDADTGTYSTDYLSNGFKIRVTTGSRNGSGDTYIFMAFAEEPLVANVGQSIPATAR